MNGNNLDYKPIKRIYLRAIRDYTFLRPSLLELANHEHSDRKPSIYRKKMRYQTRHKNVKAVLFIHVPLPKNFVATIKESKLAPELKTFKNNKNLLRKRQQLALMQEAIELALVECLKRMG